MALEEKWVTLAGLNAVVLVLGHETPSHRCGYVEVPKDSILYGKDYDEQLDCITQCAADSAQIGDKSPLLLFTAACNSDDEHNKVRRSLDIIIDCHGGLTFAGRLKPEFAPENTWWFGFDCAHAGDGKITYNKYERDFGYPVRSLEFCKLECEKIAAQLKELLS